MPQYIISPFGGENKYTEVLIKYHGDPQKMLKELSAYLEDLTCGYAVLTIPIENIQRLFSYPEIEYFELPFKLSRVLQKEMERVCITSVKENQKYMLSGQGVIVGIIDSGIDVTLRDFKNSDNTTRILSIWDQSIPGTPPNGFLYGNEYTQNDINTAIKNGDLMQMPGIDNIGHGTAVAAIAAGGGSSSNPNDTGAAPKSSLAIVKLGSGSPLTTDILRGLKYLINVAENNNMPLSVNISYGTNYGAHNSSSLFEQCLALLSQRWKTSVSVAAGNEGDSGHHASGNIEINKYKYFPFSISNDIERLQISIWLGFPTNVTVEVQNPSGQTTGMHGSSGNFLAGDVRVEYIYTSPTPNQLLQEVRLILQGATYQMEGVWNVVINNIGNLSGRVDIWLPTEEEVSDKTSFLEPDAENTLTVPATVFQVISVGGYNSGTGEYAYFSGRGIGKPDIIAPAVNVLSARVGGGYDTFTGTSFASPFVCGSAALMMEWGIVKGNDPFLYGQRIKAFLQKGAERYSYLTYPNSQAGYGILSLCHTMDYLYTERREL